MRLVREVEEFKFYLSEQADGFSIIQVDKYDNRKVLKKGRVFDFEESAFLFLDKYIKQKTYESETT